MMPFVLLSGFIFPVENMPGPIRLAAHLIPLKYYLTGVRGIFLKDLGWLDIGHETAVLFAWGLAVLSLAALRFHKRLD
jgi:ABC-2 type transport system permease protein